MPETVADRIARYLDANRGRAEALLAGLVKVPSDNPPGEDEVDCWCPIPAPRIKRAAEDVTAIGLDVQRLGINPVEAAEERQGANHCGVPVAWQASDALADCRT